MSNKTNAIKAIEAWISGILPKLPAGQEGQVKMIMDKAEGLSGQWFDDNLTAVQRGCLYDYEKGDEPTAIVGIGQDIAKRVMSA